MTAPSLDLPVNLCSSPTIGSQLRGKRRQGRHRIGRREVQRSRVSHLPRVSFAVCQAKRRRRGARRFVAAVNRARDDDPIAWQRFASRSVWVCCIFDGRYALVPVAFGQRACGRRRIVHLRNIIVREDLRALERDKQSRPVARTTDDMNVPVVLESRHACAWGLQLVLIDKRSSVKRVKETTRLVDSTPDASMATTSRVEFGSCRRPRIELRGRLRNDKQRTFALRQFVRVRYAHDVRRDGHRVRRYRRGHRVVVHIVRTTFRDRHRHWVGSQRHHRNGAGHRCFVRERWVWNDKHYGLQRAGTRRSLGVCQTNRVRTGGSPFIPPGSVPVMIVSLSRSCLAFRRKSKRAGQFIRKGLLRTRCIHGSL